jgi:hypothetical protein
VCSSVEGEKEAGLVRGRLVVGGFWMRAGGEGTRVGYLQEADLNGNIPGPIKSKVAQMQTQTTVKALRIIREKLS